MSVRHPLVTLVMLVLLAVVLVALGVAAAAWDWSTIPVDVLHGH